MGAFYTPGTGQGTATGKAAVTSFFTKWGQRPIIYPIDPWFNGMVQVFPSAKLLTQIPISLHGVQMENFRGRFGFGGRASGMLSVTRGVRMIGAHITLIGPSSEIDFSGWDQHPESVSTTIGNEVGTNLAYLLNGAYSGTPKDAAGNAVDISG